MTTNVTILYMKSVSGLGSAIMRSMQLAKIATGYVSDRYHVTARPMPKARHKRQLNKVRDLQDGVVILTKHAISDLDEQTLDHLWRHNIVLADWIDMAPSFELSERIDVHIAASMAQFRRLMKAWPDKQVEFLPHHADLRLSEIAFAPLKQMQPLYLGHPNNLKDRTDLEDDLTVVPVQAQQEFIDFLPQINRFNMHFNLRSGGRPIAKRHDVPISKPLTKAFNAATCRSNIIMQRDVEDAEEYLGADYPYLLNDDSPETARDTLCRARDDFGGAEWKYGLEVMRSVADRVSPSRVGTHLETLLDRARYVPRGTDRVAI